MLNFTAIPLILRVKIVEKMDYFAQMEFQLSSIYGKNTMNLVPCNAVVHVASITIFGNTDIYFGIPAPNSKSRWLWSKIRGSSQLPRMMVSEVTIWGDVSLDFVSELGEKIDFVQSKTHLKLLGMYPSQSSLCPVVSKVTEMFTITKVSTNEYIGADILFLPTFCEVEEVYIPIYRITDEALSRLKARISEFKENYVLFRIAPTANLYFQQWFRKERNIDWFKIYTDCRNVTFNEETLFYGIPYSVVWHYEEKSKRNCVVDIVKPFNDEDLIYELGKDDVIYSIDRGDQKLLVFASVHNQFVVALECNDLKEVIQF